MESPVGLRERKKEATRQAVHEATLRLAIEHGFDHVTVEAVADAAGISRRTFSNYFTGKEDALLYGEEKQVRELVRAMRDRPAEETAWTALRAAVAQFTERVAPPEREWALRTRLAMRHPSLLARQLANHAALERDLADAVAVRQGPTERPVRPQVLAAAFLSSLRIAMRMWIEEDLAREPSEVIDEILDEMACRFD
ncbi:MULTISPECIES: acyl-CoA-like ligand-binding transcription factor [unclassified Streptomyces]|uniref:acyl-CoA-like ligand-binding transcription factor n=1 Tax=unclassified Streptomyces TaxID=2593676 RepID=UPI002259DAC4|nr:MULTISPECIES: TetR family transcriptional regulator [unclassified Streptomyces]WSP54725.1 TetR family transcriptional regulator [Streptomyces sp. NBC_01241]WSU24596.1 TetR family transcriptional regulator [Streptomyces sp. NBC_01108]MCX4786284.1 TetR family transcriptional regulator [Streptomyces sp. NBC_01221]MCX4797858.1 TetR family transcriptional regulator [Streptomyces sp. NBC_01242]WSJ39131.1 TetR family transcriptional regulator [Streptomyces sp. NBC_01321]